MLNVSVLLFIWANNYDVATFLLARHMITNGMHSLQPTNQLGKYLKPKKLESAHPLFKSNCSLMSLEFPKYTLLS